MAFYSKKKIVNNDFRKNWGIICAGSRKSCLSYWVGAAGSIPASFFLGGGSVLSTFFVSFYIISFGLDCLVATPMCEYLYSYSTSPTATAARRNGTSKATPWTVENVI